MKKWSSLLLLIVLATGCITNPGPPQAKQQVEIIGTVKTFNQKIDDGYVFLDIYLDEGKTYLDLKSKQPISGDWIGKRVAITYTTGDYDGGGGWLIKFEEDTEFLEGEYQKIKEAQ